jgi:tRNA-splicing ligase RtcB (3'-phosphate/5'-hydroxy nucleic acid ligase)
MNLPNEKMVGKNYNTREIKVGHEGATKIIKLWNKHVTIEDAALKQLDEVASMPFVKPYVAAMPDTHWGMGATVGSVIPTVGAVMPAAVGVDIGCGMMAVRTNLTIDKESSDYVTSPRIDHKRHVQSMQYLFEQISKAVPHGRTDNGGARDIGGWGTVPADIAGVWEKEFAAPYDELCRKHPGALSRNAERHLGTLGTGNHFIEVCTEIDNPDSNLWVVIHSGSRGLGNRIGTYFTKLAGDLCKTWGVQLPNKDLGYLPIGTQEYKDYIDAVLLAQRFAWSNREIMMERVMQAIGAEELSIVGDVPSMIHMHHNYAQATKDGILTRKGAVDASLGKWVIIPGSMGAKTYIARGLGNKESFCSCSHGAGRAMSRTQALKTFTVGDHEAATAGVYCDKTRAVLDETPAAYKDIDAVMESQRDLVEPVLKIKQLVCVKGLSD